MQAFHILDVKPFMQFLLQPGELDSYDFISGEIQMDMKYTLNGHLNSSFYSTEELETLQLTQADFLPWSIVRERFFQLIKGKKTPAFLKIVLRLSQKEMEAIIQQNTKFSSHDIDGMFVNITFQGQKLNVICGISYKIFSMSKDLEEDFSSYFITLLKSNQITFEN